MARTIKNARRIVEFMIESEQDFFKLYLKYSRIFPNSEFWLELARDQNIHVEWLTAFMESSEVEKIETDIAPPAFIGSINSSLKEQINSEEETSLPVALAKVMYLENTFLENRYADVFHGSAKSVRDIIERLVSDSKKHRVMIENEIIKYHEKI